MLEELVRKYQEATRQADAKQRRGEATVKWGEAAIARARKHYPSWITAIVEPLGKRLCADLCERTGQEWEPEVLGPFGISPRSPFTSAARRSGE